MAVTLRLRRQLVEVAMGRMPAELVIRDGRWLCVQSGEILEHTDVAIYGGRFAYVGESAGHCIGPRTRLIDAQGRFLVPGLLDAHMHVESGMVTVTQFVRAVVPHGTTGMFVDPHEIANVFGLRGVKLMVDEARRQPIHVWVQMPSCVPSAPGLETPGASVGPAEVREAMEWPGIIGLGEMMNFPGVVNGDRKMLGEITATLGAGKTVGGHFASPELGRAFHGYVAGGAEDDHEGTRIEDAVARVRQGMKPMLRYGSAWHDVKSQVGAILDKGLDPRRFILCTDDSHAQTLAEDGHMDRVVRHAIRAGLAPMAAIQMATLNAAEHFGLSREMGMIAPGRWADIVLVRDLEDFRAELVIGKGAVLAEAGEWKQRTPKFVYPAWARKSVRLKRPLSAKDFVLKVPKGETKLTAHVIGVIENQAPTRHLKVAVEANGNDIRPDPAHDLVKVAVVRRHAGMNGVSVGLVSGFGLTAKCGIASTVAHDCHHMIVMGTNEEQMAIAANELTKNGGGQVVVRDGRVIGMVELSIAGLMSTEEVHTVARKAETVLAGFRACGCELNNPNMQFSLLALAVIPELRISDRGLVDVDRFELIPVLERN
jgi:adenine deaminase